MGQAFDRDGELLGEAEGATRSEVLQELERRFPEAAEIRIMRRDDEREAAIDRELDGFREELRRRSSVVKEE